MEQKLFSIITPTYNCAPKVVRTINSVLAQDSNLFEYIVIDGESNDGTQSEIQRFDGRIKFVSEPDRGVYDGMNKGIEMARGKYIYFLGAGDTLRANALGNLAALMPDGELAFIYGNVYWVDEAFIYGGEFNKSRLETYNICHQAIFYERAIFDEIGRYELDYPILADYVFNIKCFGNDKIQKTYLDYVVANFEGGGQSARQKDDALIEALPRLIEEYLR
ncbi:MAG TPA: glycosyltransferase family 2 protein [Pyrinomonadaceae bacterium]|nr:glycosyltransferase family 2 protein [Pyrinomonadaceae bacterium]